MCKAADRTAGKIYFPWCAYITAKSPLLFTVQNLPSRGFHHSPACRRQNKGCE